QLVLRTNLSGNPSYRELLGRVRETALGAYAHQDMPFEQLVQELSPERDLNRTPLFQVKLVLQNVPQAELRSANVVFSGFGADSQVAKFDLILILNESKAGMIGVAEYATDLYERLTIERFLKHIRLVVEAMVVDVEKRIDEIALLTGGGRAQVLVEWNDTQRESGEPRWMHQIFEWQAARRPDAVAIIRQGEQLSYAALNERANQLAHYLRDQGVGTEVRVAISLERSPEMMITLLGVLKSGGAYFPLDPGYPVDRLSFMLEDGQASILLTQSDVRGQLPSSWLQSIELDREWETISGYPSTNPEVEIPGS